MYINFTIKAVNHNNKTPLFKFSPTEDIIAIASGSIVTIYSADGSKLDSFNTGETVLDLSWSENGEQLIVLSLNSHLAFIWRSKQRVSTKLTLDIEEPLSIAQSYKSNWVACGSSLGHLFLYDTFTAQKLTISSKHSKRIVSLTFTHGSDYIASLSPESLIISNTSGDTIAYLRQKQIGGIFVNRVTAVQIKTPDGAQDGVVIPVFFDQTIQKKNKSEITTDFTGMGLMILNVDKQYLSTVKQTNDAYNLITSLKAQTYGNAYVQVPMSVENEAIIDLRYVYGQSGNFAPQVCCLTTIGNIISFSIDHGRQDMAIATLDSKFKYFTVVNKRETKYCSQSATFQSYMSYITDLNSIYAVQEMSQGVTTYNSKLLQNLSPCMSVTLLASCKDSSILLTPNDKSINQYDSSQTTSAEQIYVDFTGGKDSLGMVNNYPTNIGSSASGNMCFIAFANGSSMMILTKSVNQCMVSQFDSITQIMSSLSDGFQFPLHKNNGITLLNITSPKSAQIFKVMPAKYSTPVIGSLKSELIFNVEPQLTHIGQNSVAFYTTSSNQIFFSKLSISQSDQLQNSWQSCQQLYACQLEMCVVDDTLLPVARTLDGQVIVHGAGGLQATVNCPSKVQHVKASGEFIYCLTEKAQLVLYHVKLNMDSITLSLISNVQCSNKFQGNASASTDDSIGANLIKLLPGGIGCFIYKKASSCNIQLYLSSENMLLDDIFEEEVIPVKIIFDISLLTVFTVFCSQVQQNTQNPEDLNADIAYVGSLCYSLSDRSGPGVLFKKSSMVKKSISSLPVFTSNCMSFHMANKHIMEAPPIPGIQNVHQVFAQLKQVPELLSTNTISYIKQWNPLLPISHSMIQVIEQNGGYMDGSTSSVQEDDHLQVQVQLIRKYPDYNKVALPSQSLSLLKGCVELNNLGICDLALIFALRSNNLNLLKYTGDTALRVCDFETADVAFGELSLVKAENPDYAHNEYSDVFTLQDQTQIAEYLQEVNKCQYLQALNSPTSAHQCDPSAFCMFLSQLCLQETELSTAMALSLVLAAPSDSGMNNSIQDQFLDQAEKLLLQSNKPGLALSFRVDALDWSTSSVLAKKISSPYIRGEILIQQAGELESKGQFQEALDVCISLLRQNETQQQIDMFQLPLPVQPLFVGVVTRSYAHLGRVQECKEFALPPKKQGKYELRSGDPLNVMQRARLCYDCAVVFTGQKRFGDAAVFYEATAALAGRTYKKLGSELQGLGSGEISLYDVVKSGKGDEMLLFKLLPELNKVAQKSFNKLYGADGNGNGYDVSTDLQLLRQLDGDTEWKARNEVSQTLPNKLSDVISPQDLTELVPAAALSKAVHCYIQQRMYPNAEALIDYVNDPAIIADLARVFMREDPQKALKLFKRAGKCVEEVECLLNLKKVQEAEDAVKEQKRNYDKAVMAGSGSGIEPGKLLEQEQELRQSAGVLASFFRRANAPKKAVFYSLLAELYDEAFELAIQTNSEAVLVRFVTGKAPVDFLRRAAKFFASPDPNSTEKRPRNIEAAAKFLELSGGQGVDSAIKLLLNFGNGTSDIDKAIDLLRQSRSMVDYVLKYLQGGSDGVKKNPIYIFKLYLALDRYAEASKTAFLLADREIDAARYGRARALLLTCQQKLFQASGGKCPQKFREKLILLHAVETGRQLASMGLHYQAGMCLYRASRMAASLGDNAASVVLGACVECWRGGQGLRRQAYECACQMLREYQSEIPEKYAKAVDTVVRKYKKDEQTQDTPLQCCQCGAALQPGVLSCQDCQAVLPLDTASGTQITCSDFAECPHCRWFCSRLGLAEIYSTEQVKSYQTNCMMCGKAFDIQQPYIVDQASFEAAVGSNGSGCSIDFNDRDPKPLLVYEDSAIARKRYQAWVKEWEVDVE